MSDPFIVAIDGPHGAGKTTLVNELVEDAERRRRRIFKWSHKAPPADLSHYEVALHYAAQRAGMVRQIRAMQSMVAKLSSDGARTIHLVDRWTSSTVVRWSALQREQRLRTEAEIADLAAVRQVAMMEKATLPRVCLIMLRVPVDVARARIETRGEVRTPEVIDLEMREAAACEECTELLWPFERPAAILDATDSKESLVTQARDVIEVAWRTW